MGVKAYRCLDVLAREHLRNHPQGYDFESADPQCPLCGAIGDFIAPVLRIHLYAPDPRNGPILTQGGKRLRVACQPNAVNPEGKPCTDNPQVVTCTECKKTADYRRTLDAWQAIAGGIALT